MNYTNNIKVGLVSLGCDKNRVDSEIMLNDLATNGFSLVSNPKDADVIIVNTCAFIEPARKESIDTILEMASYKNNGNCKKLIVTGCLPQMYQKELFEELVEADYITGVNCENIAQILSEIYNKEDRELTPTFRIQSKCSENQRVLTTPKYLAYLKIADGCDNFCTYCTIPYIRGRFRSREIDSLVEEATMLCSNGVKELILVAQDVTKYGYDLYGEPKIVKLIQKLSLIDGLHWIRLLYCYPELIDDKLLEEVENNPKVCKYIDIPLQHVDKDILKSMNRRSTNDSVVALFDKLTNKYSNISIRSTFICGFPGETEQQSNEIALFLQKYKPSNVGFFAYSQEENTVAGKMTNQIDDKTKMKRVDSLYNVQRQIVLNNNENLIGQTVECIIEKDNGTFYLGRTSKQAPDIDATIKIFSNEKLQIGNFYTIKITSYSNYDLEGRTL